MRTGGRRGSCCKSQESGFIKYHLKDGDDVTVAECEQYAIECNFIMDEGSNMAVNENGQLIIEDGCLIMDGGCLDMDGCLKFKD